MIDQALKFFKSIDDELYGKAKEVSEQIKEFEQQVRDDNTREERDD